MYKYSKQWTWQHYSIPATRPTALKYKNILNFENDLHEHNNYINSENKEKFNLSPSNSKTVTTLNHGQYVAVMWNNKWARGVVSLESQLLIWLIDYGINLRPNETSIFIDLPLEYRKLPTKIFEASLHGVVPVDKVLSEDCRITNCLTTSWTPGSIKLAEQLIKDALKIYFQPIGIMSTQHNDVVIGDLFLEIPGKGIVNIINELDIWPVFLEKNQEFYVSNFSKCYITRRSHRSCTMKPDLPFNLPILTLQTGLEEYNDILDKLMESEDKIDGESILDDSSTVVDFPKTNIDTSKYKITPEDIETYSRRYIIFNGQEHNVLTILINKARDLNICEKYKDYDLKSVGRGISPRTLRKDNNI